MSQPATRPASTILACLDGSAYAGSVCEHAAWLLATPGAALDLLHVARPEDPPVLGPGLLEEARARIADHGASVRAARLGGGEVFEAVVGQETAGGIVVAGKRGEAGAGRRLGLGSNAAALLRGSITPLLLVSQVYLPIHRGLVLIDADPSHRRTVDYVADHPLLRALQLDIILTQPPGEDPEPKLSWARRRLGDGDADIFPLQYGSPNAAAARYIEDHQVDLLIFSRQMLFRLSGAGRAALEARPFWGWRTPILIC